MSPCLSHKAHRHVAIIPIITAIYEFLISILLGIAVASTLRMKDGNILMSGMIAALVSA